MPGCGRYAAEARPTRRGRDQPGSVVDVGADPGADAWTNWAGAARIAPPVAGAIDAEQRISRAESRVNGDSIVGDGHVQVVLVNLSCREGWIVFKPHCNRVGWCDQIADGITHDKNAWCVTLQT